MELAIIGLIALAILVITVLFKAVRIVPQTVALIVERLGRYHRTMDAGLHFLVPFVDRVRAGVDLREQVVSFPPQPVITSDNLVVSIDSVIYFQVTDPKSAVYEIANYITAIEQLTVTTLRNVIGSMDLEQTLTSRDQINGQLRGVLDEATGRWGIRVNRVELKAIDPPASVQGSMEQQMRAERDRRAAILTAEGVKQSQILTAEGEKQAAILRAEGEAQSAILRAEGEARAILQVFDAIHEGDADPKLLAYQYLQKLPEIANGSSSKMWIVPAEFTTALNGIASGFGGTAPEPVDPQAFAGTKDAEGRRARRERLEKGFGLTDPTEALEEARRQAEAARADATTAGTRSGRPANPRSTVGQNPDEAPNNGTGQNFAPPAPRPVTPPQSPDQGQQPPAPPAPQQ
ncbi:SPFH domain-containing protein [Jonesia denitrificans]|uniref:Band 7 protein n=1 Tax=Jonesia denitrificans (strain ATCC 14870 / DSM 20603 / BCRC 15368 / CIP 55.134 / JCM 11481 / NBRC 15587 / NCTC 10816 / Prevot 55134) TaxID=471856 RepID=C7R3X8_JONDD|nr:SPFH domain-containing protein [Jonesia denitrificans]ACV08835.1 band 7 protein [Jonesia denitrificans DSM 20603]ASE09845.1 SPFH/Band 7/PHB domain protein [Jonesia denitrificans]QXB44380.1 SPFH/Band 7/PHB domain protein [Jonesia denitrificans]SQH20824.1 FtsH protease regulator HflK [Jonesia denitrificans]